MEALAAVSRDVRRRTETESPLLAEAIAEVNADLDELLFLVRSAEAKLAATGDELAESRAGLYARTLEALTEQIDAARSRWDATGRRLLALRGLAYGHGEATRDLLAKLTAEKAACADLLRAEQALVAALASAADWQSPSFLHSTLPMAGKQCGRIRPHWNDYKRDRHLDAEDYEHAYRAQMVDGPRDVRALLTSCGMAAFTTVVSLLRDEGRLDGPVLIGRGLYHESRQLLERGFARSPHVVDERNTGALLDAIGRLRPSVIFLDSLSNTKWTPVPDLPAVLERVRGTPTCLVVDNTGLSVSCQPFALAHDSVRLIVFESLLKYAQLGLDRTNAGVIIACAEDAEALAGYREHLGTNVGDVAVHSLPPPQRHVVVRRLGRIQRNALLLAERLKESSGRDAEIVYPGLPDHPSHAVARRLPFRGGWLSIVLRETDGTLRHERALVERAVAEAARRGVALIGGSSFGFNTTRVYLTGARADRGEPFVRLAAGTEHRLDVELLAEALAAAVRQAGS